MGSVFVLGFTLIGHPIKLIECPVNVNCVGTRFNWVQSSVTLKNAIFGPWIFLNAQFVAVNWKISIYREDLRKSRIIAANVKNRELSWRMGKIAISHVPRFPFDLEIKAANNTVLNVWTWESFEKVNYSTTTSIIKTVRIAQETQFLESLPAYPQKWPNLSNFREEHQYIATFHTPELRAFPEDFIRTESVLRTSNWTLGPPPYK